VLEALELLVEVELELELLALVLLDEVELELLDDALPPAPLDELELLDEVEPADGGLQTSAVLIMSGGVVVAGKQTLETWKGSVRSICTARL
jgi:hypothetical protein